MMKRRNRWLVRAAVCLAAIASGLVLAPQAAPAYTLSTFNGACNGPGQDPLKFGKGTVNVVLHYGESKALFFDILKILAVMRDVHDQINQMGGSSVRIGSVTATTDPFTFGTPFSDTTPTIHVGFAPSLADPSFDGEGSPLKPANSCTYTEAHVAFLDFDTHRWTFGDPADFWLAGATDTATSVCKPPTPPGTPNCATVNPTYFQPVYLHELLHAFGLAHSDSTFSFMNYGERPWANRPAGDKIRPLPDDLRAMRYLYPDTSNDRYEIGVLDNWDDDSTLSSIAPKAAYARPLCAPSLGTDFDSAPGHRFAYYPCGTGGPNAGSIVACEGDSLKTRFALVNYGTGDVEGTVSLYFSTDSTFDLGSDIYAGDFDTSLVAAGSKLHSRAWKVPALTSGTKYYTILYVTMWKPAATGASVDPATMSSDWIPLRGTITGC
ncbi:MAG TPA: matrixin family metalloprotease [Dactylosporangium sp.]|nr:matrixin family metalloprotease [Dactylosporangium sp.]